MAFGEIVSRLTARNGNMKEDIIIGPAISADIDGVLELI